MKNFRTGILSLLLSLFLVAPASAQGIVGSWGYEFIPNTTGGSMGSVQWTFQSNGRWLWSTAVSIDAIQPYLDPATTDFVALCSANGVFYTSQGGSYTASGNALSMAIDSTIVCGETYSTPLSLGQGTYTIMDNILSISLTGGEISPFTMPGLPSLASRPTIVPTTPLPPPAVEQTEYVASIGVLPAEAVAVTATGTFGRATISVTVDVGLIDQQLTRRADPGSGSFAASAGQNIYVVALVPGAVTGSAAPVFFVKPQAPANWGPMEWPMAAFMSNISPSAATDRVVIDMVSDTDISNIVGTEIYVGYGTSGEEMIAARRFRGVYRMR